MKKTTLSFAEEIALPLGALKPSGQLPPRPGAIR
jgi:hypothetical protein